MSAASIGAIPAGIRAMQTEPDGAEALPHSITDGAGRRYELQVDAATGQARYVHESAQRDAAGSTQTLRITLAPRDDGSLLRTVDQELALASGDSRSEQSIQNLRADGTLASERTTTIVRQGTQVQESVTDAQFDAAGQLVAQTADIVQTQSSVDAASGESTTVTITVRGTWNNDGLPIPDDHVPTIERTETESVSSPGDGINRDTARHLEFTRSATGTTEALEWASPGTMTVRFDGHGDQYIERELAVPLDADGTPDFGAAEEVSSTDAQSLVSKAATQARIWGGLASNLAWIGGVLTGIGTPVGRGLVIGSTVAGGAQLAGEIHAVADRRNDGDAWRVASAGYDTVMSSLLLVATRRSSGLGGQVNRTLASSDGRSLALRLGTMGVVMNGAELFRSTSPETPQASALRDAVLGSRAAGGSPVTRPVGGADDLVGAVPADILVA